MTKDLTKVSHRELVLHAVFLLRTVNKHSAKEKDVQSNFRRRSD